MMQATVLSMRVAVMNMQVQRLNIQGRFTSRTVTHPLITVEALEVSGPLRVLDSTVLFVDGAVRIHAGTSLIQRGPSLGVTFALLIVTGKFLFMTDDFHRRHKTTTQGDPDEHASR